MAEAKRKNYIGNGKKNSQYDLINMSINKDKFNALPANEKGYVSITVAALKETGKYGETHCVFENDWKPTPKTEGVGQTQNGAAADESSLPY